MIDWKKNKKLKLDFYKQLLKMAKKKARTSLGKKRERTKDIISLKQCCIPLCLNNVKQWQPYNDNINPHVLLMRTLTRTVISENNL